MSWFAEFIPPYLSTPLKMTVGLTMTPTNTTTFYVTLSAVEG